jgi:hypothetical protein
MFHAACKDSLFAPTKNLMAGLEKYHTRPMMLSLEYVKSWPRIKTRGVEKSWTDLGFMSYVAYPGSLYDSLYRVLIACAISADEVCRISLAKLAPSVSSASLVSVLNGQNPSLL